VINPDGQSDLLETAFRYVAPPIPEAATPTHGPTAGDTRVIVAGTGFDFTSTVTLDGIPAPSVTFVDPQTIGIRTPAHALGAVDLRVENSDGQFGVLARGFTYSDTIDGGLPTSPDAAPGSEPPGRSGCVCRAAPAPASAPASPPASPWAAILLALLLARRQRR
jgi:MYXO-CTERM domain-containing protein